MPEDHQNERLPKTPLEDKALRQNTPPKPDPDKSAGELSEGRPHATEAPAAFPDRDPSKKKTGEF